MIQVQPEYVPVKLFAHYFSREKYQEPEYHLGSEAKDSSKPTNEPEVFNFNVLLNTLPLSEALYCNRIRLHRLAHLETFKYSLKKWCPEDREQRYRMWVGW